MRRQHGMIAAVFYNNITHLLVERPCTKYVRLLVCVYLDTYCNYYNCVLGRKVPTSNSRVWGGNKEEPG